jgi:hypothetical protein
MSRLAAICLILLVSSTAAAHPPPEPIEIREHRPTVEWSSWFRLGYGVDTGGVDATARATGTPAPAEAADTWEAAFGADFSLPVSTPAWRPRTSRSSTPRCSSAMKR